MKCHKKHFVELHILHDRTERQPTCAGLNSFELILIWENNSYHVAVFTVERDCLRI